jgi:hypothetical protein
MEEQNPTLCYKSPKMTAAAYIPLLAIPGWLAWVHHPSTGYGIKIVVIIYLRGGWYVLTTAACHINILCCQLLTSSASVATNCNWFVQ